MKLEFGIRAVGLAQIPDKRSAILGAREKHFGESHSPWRALVLGVNSPGVSSRIGGKVIGAVLVDGPVQKLQMAVAAEGVVVEIICDGEFADSQFQTTGGQPGEGGQGPAVAVDGFVAEREDLVIDHAGEIGRVAQGRVPDGVKIGESRDPHRAAQAQAAGFLEIKQHLDGFRELVTGVEGHHAAVRLVICGPKAVKAGVIGVEWRVGSGK